MRDNIERIISLKVVWVLRSISDMEFDTPIYVPFASKLLSTLDEEFDNITIEYTDADEKSKDEANTKYGKEEFGAEIIRPTRYCRVQEAWFDQKCYDHIVCELPDKKEAAAFLINQLIKATYQKAYLLVPPTFLGEDDMHSIELRKKLFKSGRIAWIMSLPEVCGKKFGLICLSTNGNQESLLIDAFSLYATHNFQAVDETYNLRELFYYLKRVVLKEVEQKDFCCYLKANKIDNRFILNPKYYICPLPYYEGIGSFEYVELKNVMSRMVVRRPTEYVPAPLFCKELASQSEYELPKLKNGLSEMEQLLCVNIHEDCMLDFYSVDDNVHKTIYWRASKYGNLNCIHAHAYQVDTSVVYPEYLLHLLYRKDLFLQIPVIDDFDCLKRFYDSETNSIANILIPIPKGKNASSLEIQKGLYEEVRSQYLNRFETIMVCNGSSIEEKQDYGVSSLLLTKDGFIYLPEFKKTLNMETMQRALYLFLLKKVEGNILLTNKNMMDYTYEISRIYHALKHSYIVYSKDTPDYDDYLKVGRMLGEELSSKTSKMNRLIKQTLSKVTTQYDLYMIPQGSRLPRNITHRFELCCERNGLFPTDFFSTPSMQDECFERGRIYKKRMATDYM